MSPEFCNHAIIVLLILCFIVSVYDVVKKYWKKPILIKFVKCHKNAIIPQFVHKGDSGFDLHTIEKCVLLPHTRKILRTGLKVEIPNGCEIQIRPRSGISAGTNITVIKGTIDSGYRGEIGVIAHNTGSKRIVIRSGERLAQGVVGIVPKVKIIEVKDSELSKSSRGEKGYGSTGI